MLIGQEVLTTDHGERVAALVCVRARRCPTPAAAALKALSSAAPVAERALSSGCSVDCERVPFGGAGEVSQKSGVRKPKV